ncbi:flagellar protein FlaG [Rhodocyclus gracilis]|uniref:Flagellar protein n=1 Tax=Rhodocyclus tenuis TaxID=1066 RepID=A0A6L5JW39_RHOTE|nr:flagellar protein FlaG [Rhodocyclus gracilis]MQY51575.1 flagellar protein [Rhodocyclus gracilis]
MAIPSVDSAAANVALNAPAPKWPQSSAAGTSPADNSTAVGVSTSTGSTNQTDTSKQDVKAGTDKTKLEDANNPRKEDVKSAVEKVRNFVQASAADIQFSIDQDSHGTIVKVIDRGTGDVIRQIPSKEMVDIAKALDKLQGLFVKQSA